MNTIDKTRRTFYQHYCFEFEFIFQKSQDGQLEGQLIIAFGRIKPLNSY